MRIAQLELIDVRSYRRVHVSFDPGVTVFVGPNAQGKTNIIEAIHRISTGGSHRVASDAVLVRVGAESGAIRARVVDDTGRTRSVDVELRAGRSRVRVDGHPVRRAVDAIGVVRTVLFAPEDLAIIRGDPAARRGFLDGLLAQRRPAYATVRAEYERALRQRNQLLKHQRGLSPSAREQARVTLDSWSEQLVHHGSQLLAARLAGVDVLAPEVDDAYRYLADRPEPVSLRYRSTVTDELCGDRGDADGARPAVADIAARFHTVLEERRADELARGVTLAGPHRDDFDLKIGTLLARSYASHGEAWSAALALRLGSAAVLAEVGDRPIVLLDDVFAELDETRRHQLAERCSQYDQVLVTAAVEADVPLTGRSIDVRITDGESALTPRMPAGDEAGAAAGPPLPDAEPPR